MKYARSLLAAIAVSGVTAATLSADTATELRGPEAFSDIAAETDRSVALFEEMAKVFTHPRCLNCHPRDDMPRQGDLMEIHQPPVVRGAGGMGPVGMQCTTCHGEANVDFAGATGSIPGHVPWHLPPVSMGWIGLSVGEICEQVKDPARNGDMTLVELHEHNANDGLVGWAWEPGSGRTPAPGSQEIFGALTQAWIDTGAACPG